jgi:hypothetical protein
MISRSVGIALVLAALSLACREQGLPGESQAGQRHEVVKTAQRCEPWPEFRCVWEDHSVTLRGQVAGAGASAARVVEVFDRDEGGEKPIATVATSMQESSFTFVIPIERNGHERCVDGHVEYSMNTHARTLRVEAPGCEAVKVICRDACEPVLVTLDCS